MASLLLSGGVYKGIFNMIDEGIYKTTDLYLSAYLNMLKKQIVKLERKNIKRCEFTFLNVSQTEVDDYFQMHDVTSALSYANSLKDVKSMMYSIMDADVEEAEGDRYKKKFNYKIQR